MTRHLLIIDPQNDFCDIPDAAPALPVAGADEDMRRLAHFIASEGSRIDQITVTLDSHSPIDIAHPTWWEGPDGKSPSPFTVISVADVEGGKWRARDPARRNASLSYVRALNAGGKYALVIWPEHCLIGSWGHNIHKAVKEALDTWSRHTLKPVNVVFKGMNPATEHYSAVRAEVPDASDPGTEINRELIASLARADEILVAGEALSHCVASTVRDIADALPASTAKLTLLADCSSPVPGFEALGTAFVDDLSARGMRISSTSEAFA